MISQPTPTDSDQNGAMSSEDELEDVLDELARVNNELLSAQRALERRTAELDRAVERMNQLLGMAAHDLRNPIGSIRGFAQTLLLRSRGRLEPQEAELLERIAASSDKMLRLVHELLDLSTLEHGVQLELEEIDLRTVVAEAVGIAGVAAADKQITVRLTAPETVPLVGDPVKLEEVVMNLLTNAIKYSHRGGRVDVTLEDAGDHAELHVADDGVGIPDDEHETMFEPFNRASSLPTEGESSTGLGLTIARLIVRAHGGRLTVESSEGHGATFTVILPRRSAARAEDG